MPPMMAARIVHATAWRCDTSVSQRGPGGTGADIEPAATGPMAAGRTHAVPMV